MDLTFHVRHLPDATYRLDPFGVRDDETAVGLSAALATGLDPDGVGVPHPVVTIALPGAVEFAMPTAAARLMADHLRALAEQAENAVNGETC